MKLTYYGHSCFRLEAGSHRFLIDPFFSGNPLATVRAEEQQADFILVTHGHGDHLGDAVPIAKACGGLLIAPTELANWCAAQGAQVHAMYMGSHEFPFGRLTMMFASHGSSIPTGDGSLYGGVACGYVLEVEGKRIYHAGDTGLFGDMQLVGSRGKVDVALLPIGGNYTMDPAEALTAAKLVQAEVTIPMHYNTFPVIRQDPAKFVAELAAAGLGGRVLAPGETLEL